VTAAGWTHPWAEFDVTLDNGPVPTVVVPSVPTDLAALRGMFAQHPTGIAAICAELGGVAHGMVATSFSVGASFEPPLVLFSAQNNSKSWPRLAAAPQIGVSVLSADNAVAVRRLASRLGDRFDGVHISRNRLGAIFVVGARLWLDCRVVSQLPLGDHTLVALEVLGSSSLPTAVPLVYHDGKVISVDSHE
jgi:flavin reductase (DIM6/NTAB) family NADH-FMN oxidoreductase RutF